MATLKTHWIIWTRHRGVAVPTNGLLAYYPFEENWNDISGNENNATVVWCSFGQVGNKKWVRLETGWWYDPSNYIISPLTYIQTPVTAICWIYQTYQYNRENFMSNTQQDQHPDSSNNIRLRTTSNRFLLTSYWTSEEYFGKSSYLTIPLNEWKMVWITISGTSGILYIDGEVYGTFTAWTQNWNTGPRAWGRAERQSSWFHCWCWWIRHSAIYNRAITTQEMRNFYTQTV